MPTTDGLSSFGTRTPLPISDPRHPLSGIGRAQVDMGSVFALPPPSNGSGAAVDARIAAGPARTRAEASSLKAKLTKWRGRVGMWRQIRDRRFILCVCGAEYRAFKLLGRLKSGNRCQGPLFAHLFGPTQPVHECKNLSYGRVKNRWNLVAHLGQPI